MDSEDWLSVCCPLVVRVGQEEADRPSCVTLVPILQIVYLHFLDAFSTFKGQLWISLCS